MSNTLKNIVHAPEDFVGRQGPKWVYLMVACVGVLTSILPCICIHSNIKGRTNLMGFYLHNRE